MQNMVQNWIFGAWQNATELKTFGVIWKLESCWVRKNCEKIFVASFSPKKWRKMVKNWNFGMWQNATELQKFGVILKLLPWWVRKSYKILLVAPFLPSKRWKTMKIGQKLKFSGVTKCDGAPKIWCHFKAFAMVSEIKLQNFGRLTIFTFKTMKNGQNWSKNWNFRTWQHATELQKFGAILKLLPWWVR